MGRKKIEIKFIENKKERAVLSSQLGHLLQEETWSAKKGGRISHLVRSQSQSAFH